MAVGEDMLCMQGEFASERNKEYMVGVRVRVRSTRKRAFEKEHKYRRGDFSAVGEEI